MPEIFERRNLSGAVFHDVNLQGACFDDVNLAQATIRNANLSGLTITDAYIAGLTVFGFAIDQLIAAEQDRRDPERVRLRPADPFDPACWPAIFQRQAELRRAFCARLRAADPAALAARSPEGWSALEILRHLIFAEDLYIHRWILQDATPWCPHGLLPDFLRGQPAYAGVGSQPEASLETLLAAWERIHADTEAFLSGLTAEQLRRDTRALDFGQGTLAGILQTLVQHDLEHIRQAERALA
jgi:uncharacterized damage-inducible protein DinB